MKRNSPKVCHGSTGFEPLTSLCAIIYFTWSCHQVQGASDYFHLTRKTQAVWGKCSCTNFDIAAEAVFAEMVFDCTYLPGSKV